MSSFTQKDRHVSGNNESDALIKEAFAGEALDKKAAILAGSHGKNTDRQRKILHLNSGK